MPRKRLSPEELVQRRTRLANYYPTREEYLEQLRLDDVWHGPRPSTTRKAETKQPPTKPNTPIPEEMCNASTPELGGKGEDGGRENEGSEIAVVHGPTEEGKQPMTLSVHEGDASVDLNMPQPGEGPSEGCNKEEDEMISTQTVPQMLRVHSHKVEEAASSEHFERARTKREFEKTNEEAHHEKPKQQQQVKKGLLDGPRGGKRKKTDGADPGDEAGGALDVTLDDVMEETGEQAEKIKDRKRGDKDAPRMPRHAPDNK